MIESIFLTWLLSTAVSFAAMWIGVIRCANYFGWDSKISTKDNEFLIRTYLINLIPGWNLSRSIQFAFDPFKYIHG